MRTFMLYGKALYDNGVEVPEFILTATPRGALEKNNQKGHIQNIVVQTQPGGYFEISGLVQAFYTIELVCPDAVPIHTNIQFVAGETFLDATFYRAPSVSGTVRLAETGEPVPDVAVHFSSLATSLPPQTVTTDNNGIIETRLKAATYEKCPVRQHGKEYYSAAFTITPETKERTIQLNEMGTITGIALLNREPINGKSLIFYAGDQEYRVPVSHGSYTLHAPPGEYIVRCTGIKTATEVMLDYESDNTIELFTGQCSCEITLPMQAEYTGKLLMDFDGLQGHMESIKIGRDDNPVWKTFGLPEGKYVFSVRGKNDTTVTNITVHFELYKNEDKKINLQEQ